MHTSFFLCRSRASGVWVPAHTGESFWTLGYIRKNPKRSFSVAVRSSTQNDRDCSHREVIQ